MKQLFLLLFFAILPLNSIGQTYNSVISDEQVLAFLNWEINQTVKDKSSLKKIYINPLKWTDENFKIKDSIVNSFEYDYDYLFKKQDKLDSIFTSEDKDLIYKQYKTQKQFNWKKLKSITISNDKINTYLYSMPIFSGDYVLICKSSWRGTLSGHGGYYVYKKSGNAWKLIKIINPWIS